MWWKIVIFIVCLVHIFITGRAKHVYKCEFQGFDRKNVGIVMGSVLGTALECLAGWYAVDFIAGLF
jgi:hypothetical protein